MPVTALRRTAADPRLLRLQLAWAAVMVASWTVTVTLSVVAFAEGGSAAVGLAVLARAVPGVVVGPLVGSLADRFSRRRCLVVSASLCGVVTAAAVPLADSLVAVIGLITVVALVTMLFRTAQSAVLPELVDDPLELTAANVVSSGVESVGLFAGPALAAALLSFQGPELAFGGAAALFLGAGLTLLGLPRQHPSADGADVSPKRRTSELLRLRSARLLLAVVLVQTLVSGGLVVLYPALAVEALGLDVSAVGVLAAAFGLGGVVGSLGLFALAGSRHLGALAAVALLLWALPLLVLLAGPSYATVLLLLAVAGGGNVLFDVTVVTLLQRAVPLRLLGRTFGFLETVIVVGLGAGAALAPLLDRLLGPAGALAVLAGLLALVAAVAVRPLRRLDASLGAPVRQVALLRALPAFALLPALQLERLALQLRRVELAAGEAAARQGEPGRTWFLVETGRLGVRVDGRPVRDLGPGEGFGEIALLRQGVRTATVTADEPSVVWALDGDVFLAALRADGGRALAALDAVAQEHLRRAAPAKP